MLEKSTSPKRVLVVVPEHINLDGVQAVVARARQNAVPEISSRTLVVYRTRQEQHSFVVNPERALIEGHVVRLAAQGSVRGRARSRRIEVVRLGRAGSGLGIGGKNRSCLWRRQQLDQEERGPELSGEEQGVGPQACARSIGTRAPLPGRYSGKPWSLSTRFRPAWVVARQAAWDMTRDRQNVCRMHLKA